MAILAKADEALRLLPYPDDPVLRTEACRLLFMSLAAGFPSAFTESDYPDFVPVVSSTLNSVGVNPDFIYAYSHLDGTGVYRLFGDRGDGIFLLFDVSSGGLGALDQLAASLGLLDVDKFTVTDGAFDIVLSTTRPPGYDGDWFPLDPSAKTISVRQASYDWGAGREARIAIERLDRPLVKPRIEAAEIARRLTLLAGHPRRYAEFALRYGVRQREQGYINRLEHDDWAGRGGVAGQHYYQGIFKIEPDQALIIETALPERVRYWNIQLNDWLWNTIDWFNHQSSLNGGQAMLDADGRFRAVIALDDPGVPNWLDPGGFREGSLMLRWTEASSGPEPTLRLVPLAELRSHLPASTPTVTPKMREDGLRTRRRGAQLRRRW
jgi:hypothetical protein